MKERPIEVATRVEDFVVVAEATTAFGGLPYSWQRVKSLHGQMGQW